MSVGRPSKLTPEIQEAIIEKILRGNYGTVAAAACGIKASTFKSWMLQGRRGKGEFSTFFSAVKKARKQAEAEMLDIIREAGEGYDVLKTRTVVYPDGSRETTTERSRRRDWQAVAWIMERTRKGKYSRNDKLAVNGDVNMHVSWADQYTEAQAWEKRQRQLAASGN